MSGTQVWKIPADNRENRQPATARFGLVVDEINDTEEIVVKPLGKQIIAQVNNISSTIATAVEEQNATTNQMARNLSEAARGSGEIVHNISGVAEAAQNTTRGALDTQKAAAELARMATSLKELVTRFKS